MDSVLKNLVGLELAAACIHWDTFGSVITFSKKQTFNYRLHTSIHECYWILNSCTVLNALNINSCTRAHAQHKVRNTLRFMGCDQTYFYWLKAYSYSSENLPWNREFWFLDVIWEFVSIISVWQSHIGFLPGLASIPIHTYLWVSRTKHTFEHRTAQGLH